MSHPQQPGYGYQGPPPSYLPPPPMYPQPTPPQHHQPSPSGVTGNIAGVLAILGGLWYLAGVVGHARIVFQLRVGLGPVLLWLLVDLVLACLLLVGGIILLTRRRAGRAMVVTGAAIALAADLVQVLTASGTLSADAYVGGLVYVGPVYVALLLTAIPAIATLVLAVVPLTGRWLRSIPPAGSPAGWP